MIEFWLFFIVGLVAVVAAVMMLISDNAVHSALFLILNFACVAFLFLMLDAPFLAMVQIAVYAGAIMVLFLFVIMLLGAEKSEAEQVESGFMPGYRFYTPTAVVLAVVLLLTVGVGILGGGIDALQDESDVSMVRVAHYAAEVDPVDVTANGDVIAEAVTYPEETGFVRLTPGDYDIEVLAAGTDDVLLSETLLLEGGTVQTVAAYGLEDVALAVVPEDLSSTPERSARLTLFNAYTEAISLQDVGSETRGGDEEILIGGVAPGETSEPIILEEGDLETLRVIPAAQEDLGADAATLGRFRDRDLERDTSTVVAAISQPLSLGAENRAFIGISVTDTASQFGSPQAVGELLFTRYLLPLEVISLVLLAALVGVIILTQRQVDPAAAIAPRRRPVRRKVSRPLTSVIANQVGGDISQGPPQLTSGDEAQPAGD